MLSKEELVELYAQGRIIIVPCAPDDPVYQKWTGQPPCKGR